MTTTAVIAAAASVLAAAIALLGSLRTERSRRRGQEDVERLKAALVARQADIDQARQTDDLMAAYINPLARSAQDLQSRLWNISYGFRGGRDPAYYRDNTLYVIAELLGWLEIVRQEVQFLDAGPQTTEVSIAISKVQAVVAETSVGFDDNFYVFRGQQRAIGELMIVPRESSRPGPTRECLGYAEFVTRLEDPTFSRWFDRLSSNLELLGDGVPHRLVRVQHRVVDLLDVLDPDCSRCQGRRRKVAESRAANRL